MQITESLSIETQELVKLDLSSCGLTSEYFAKLNIGTSSISGILELNLGGNPIMQQVHFLSYQAALGFCAFPCKLKGVLSFTSGYNYNSFDKYSVKQCKTEILFLIVPIMPALNKLSRILYVYLLIEMVNLHNLIC